MTPGYRTTEFWKSLLTGLIPVAALVLKASGVQIDDAALGATLVGLVGPLSYIIGRTWLKGQAATPAVVVADGVADGDDTVNA